MKILTGIASTTHIDRHGEKMSIGALKSMAEQIKKKYKPFTVNHELETVVGVILYAEVFKLQDNEHALGVVVGLFEDEKETQKFKAGNKNKTWKEYKDHLDVKELKSQSNESEKENKERIENPSEALAMHLDSTKVRADGTVYKIKRFIDSVDDLRIEIYTEDHGKHFHVRSRERNINATFDLNSFKLIAKKNNEIRSKDIKKIQDFLEKNPKVVKKMKKEWKRLT